MYDQKSILDKIFRGSEDSDIPTRTVHLKRLDLDVTMKGLRESAIEQLERKHTKTLHGKRGQQTRELDKHGFYLAIITAATVAIGGDESIRWDHPELLKRFEASSGEYVLKRALLAGEVSLLADVALELSGMYDDVEKEEEVKNSFEDED